MLGAIYTNGFPRRCTSQGRQMAVLPARGPIRTTLNALTSIYGSEGWVPPRGGAKWVGP